MTRVLISVGVAGLCVAPILVSADNGGFVRLVGLPFEQTGNQDINVFIQALYRLTIGVAATLAVLRLILAGAQYMFTDVVTKKEDAKTNVRTSLVGLLVVLSAVLILNTINPELTKLEALNIKPVVVHVEPPPQPEPIKIGSSYTASEITFDNFARLCQGEAMITSTNNTRRFECVKKLNLSYDEYVSMLSQNSSLSEGEIEALQKQYRNMVGNGGIPSEDWNILIQNDLYEYMNTTFTYNENIKPLQEQYIADGMTAEAAALKAAETLLRQQVIFLRNNNDGRQQDKERLCTAVGGKFIGTQANGNSYMFCLR